MTDRRLQAWLRLLCAAALGLGLSLAGPAVAAAGTQRPAVAHLDRAVTDVTPSVGWAAHVLRHSLHKHAPPTVTTGIAAIAAAIAVLVALSLLHRHRPTRAGRRTSSRGARAPPFAVGS